MDERIAALLADDTVRAELRRAWLESSPGALGGHEEGGFICLSAGGAYVVDRWETGERTLIQPSSHPDGKRNNEWIIASFHTPPNSSQSYDQMPSPLDCEGVQKDEALKTVYYLGEFVISKQQLYFIFPSGSYTDLGDTDQVLTLGEE